MKTAWTLLLALLSCGVPSLSQLADGQSLARQAFSQLQDERDTDRAANQLRAMAKSDASVREYLSANLPALIEKQAPGPVWLNAVRLAGDLKIASTVDILVAALGQNNKGGTATFAEERRLDTDPPGKALAEIGDPAVPAVTRALNSTSRDVRWRAALVLVNINSPSARAVLVRHLQDEPDARLRAFIQAAIK